MGAFNTECCAVATETWGHISLSTGDTWTSPANMTSCDIVVITGIAKITVDGITVTYNSITSPAWGNKHNTTPHPAGYVSVGVGTGTVRVTYQTIN
jgi:hypothetical protein